MFALGTTHAPTLRAFRVRVSARRAFSVGRYSLHGGLRVRRVLQID